jgi:hypothetical protein
MSGIVVWLVIISLLVLAMLTFIVLFLVLWMTGDE